LIVVVGAICLSLQPDVVSSRPPNVCPDTDSLYASSAARVTFGIKRTLGFKFEFDPGYRPVKLGSKDSPLGFKAFYYASPGEIDLKAVGTLTARWLATDAIPGSTVPLTIDFVGDEDESVWITQGGVRAGFRYKIDVNAGGIHVLHEDYFPGVPKLDFFWFDSFDITPLSLGEGQDIWHQPWGEGKLECFYTVNGGLRDPVVSCKETDGSDFKLEKKIHWGDPEAPDTTDAGDHRFCVQFWPHPSTQCFLCIDPGMCAGLSFIGDSLYDETSHKSMTEATGPELEDAVYVPCDFAQASDSVRTFSFTKGPYDYESALVFDVIGMGEPVVKVYFVKLIELTFNLGKALCAAVVPGPLWEGKFQLPFSKAEATFEMEIIDPEVDDIVVGSGSGYVPASDTVDVTWCTTWGAPDSCDCRVRLDYKVRPVGTSSWGPWVRMHATEDTLNYGAWPYRFLEVCNEARVRVEFRDPAHQFLHVDSSDVFLITPVPAEIDPYIVDLSPVAPGSYKDETITITNPEPDTLVVTVGAACPPEFTVISGDGGPFLLMEDDTHDIVVRFQPLTEGSKYCDLPVTFDVTTCPIPLMGSAQNPCVVEPSSLDFGTVSVGFSSVRTFTITNIGGAVFSIDPSESCDDFDIISGGGYLELAPLESREITVQFAPGSSGAKNCTINTGNANCATVPATGTGVTDAYCNPITRPFHPTYVIDIGATGSLDYGFKGAKSASSPGTTWLGWWTFDLGPSCVSEGWTSHDLTAQTGDYWHVTDFASAPDNCGPGTYGGLVPLEGSQSMWCGACPDPGNVILCGYAMLPGYGNNWNQALCTKNCLTVTSDVTIDFLAAWDSEPGYDATALEVDKCDDVWMHVAGGIGVWDGEGGGIQSVDVSDSLHVGSMRARFRFQSDRGWSDEDGTWNTDGAFIIDSLTVTDQSGVVLATEYFEDETVMATDADDWESCTIPGYGDYAAVYQALALVQEDACRINPTCTWSFFTGSTYDYACGGWPVQTVVPYQNARGQYISNEVWSPQISWGGTGAGAGLVFDVYRDLKLDALVFYTWRVRSIVAGCPGDWRNHGNVYCGGGKDWHTHVADIGGLVSVGATHIQVALGVFDGAGIWCGIWGSGLCHSHAPLFDNARVYRVATVGPQWQVSEVDLFQDNFATDGTVTGTVRADAAVDILPATNPRIQPGDSVTVNVGDPEAGLDYHVPGDASSGPAVYCYVTVWPQGQSGKTAGAIQAKNTRAGQDRWPYIDYSVHNGVMWHRFRMDSVFTSYGNPVADRYCIDLNDNLFTPGDTVGFVFGSRNAVGAETYYTRVTETVSNGGAAFANPMEFTCLPAGGWLRSGGILYVDGTDGLGAQMYFDTAFDMMNILDKVDRYDVRAFWRAEGNGPGGRVRNVFQQITSCYRTIIWDTGNREIALGDCSGETPLKSDEYGLLLSFLWWLDGPGGVYLSGDDIAESWIINTSADPVDLRTTYCDFNLDYGSHVAAGLGVTPLLVGEPGSMFEHIFGPDTMVAYGGCPYINDFDVISPVGTATLQMSYRGGSGGGAIVSQRTLNPLGHYVGVVLSGFSFDSIRDDRETGVLDRAEHLYDILSWLGNVTDQPVSSEPTGIETCLHQNYPNPFNPTTTIRFSLRRSSHVTLKIYNVAGQLVRTLVDETRLGQKQYSETWYGLNDAGQEVSSGVYFYRLVAGETVLTKKTLLLK
jgi:hypothetical protein